MNFLDIFSKNTQKPNFMKIRPVGAKLLHSDTGEDGRTERQTEGKSDIRKFSFPFRNFANAPKTDFHFPGYSK